MHFVEMCNLIKLKHLFLIIHTHRKYNCKESINGHQYQGVNGHICCHIDKILHSLAQNETKAPLIINIVSSCEWYAENDEKQISKCKVEYQNICCRSHLLVGDDHYNDKCVSNGPKNCDNSKQHWDNHSS